MVELSVFGGESNALGDRSRTTVALIGIVLAALAAGVAVGAPIAAAEEQSSSLNETGMDGDGPTVETSWWDTLNDSAVIVEAELTDAGDEDVADVWIEYRENGTDEWSITETKPGQAPEGVTFDVTGLEPSTTYEYRAASETAHGSDRGEGRTFETPRDRPEATTVGAIDVGEESATLATNVTDLGYSGEVEVWFSYEPADSDVWHSEWSETEKRTVDETGLATQTVDGLDPETTYEFTSHVRTDDVGGYSTGYEEFTTENPFAVETGTATNVDESSATLTGEVVNFGGADGATVHFEYRSADGEEWSTTDPVEPNSAAEIEATIDGLEPGTTYEYRAVGTASDGDADVGDVYVLGTDVDPAVETGPTIAVDDESATVSGEVVDLGGAPVVYVSVEYRAVGEDTWNETEETPLTDAKTVETTLDGLDPETEYEYRTVVRAQDAVDRGTIATLTTAAAEHDPTVETLSGADESGPNPHAELGIDWRVVDEDGDLSSAAVTVRDGSGVLVDRDEASVEGTSATGSLDEQIKHGTGDTYEVTLVVTDAAGNEATDRIEIDS